MSFSLDGKGSGSGQRGLRWIWFGGSIISDWNNPIATTNRAVIRALQQRGHQVVFIEQADDPASTAAAVMPEVIPPPPEGMKVTVGTMDEAADIPEEIDQEFRRRIEELAQRDDFDSPQGQAELRRLIEDAVLGEGGVGDERNVRSKQD